MDGVFFALPVWGVIFGRAHTWRGLFSEFYGIGQFVFPVPSNSPRSLVFVFSYKLTTHTLS